MQAFLDHYEGLMGTAHNHAWLDLNSMYHQTNDLSLLALPFTEQELTQAVASLATNKASGPDGLPNEFIKQSFDSLKPYIMNIIHKFWSEQTDLSLMNSARIALVPKTAMPESVADYRPISIINLIPKLISKLLANRIRPHIAHLIEEHQTAFVQGRYIAENFLSVREAMHHVQHSKSPALLFKIDFTKAFDTLDWGFLLNVMSTRAFPAKFIRWVYHLLVTSSSTLVINGQHSPSFMHKRGLRQGDPLSPFLFILAADVLQRMTATLTSVIPYTLTPKLPRPVLTFQYADDTIFLLTAKGPTIRSLLLVLHCFSNTSGLQVNFAKSCFVPFSIPHSHLPTIQLLLNCSPHDLPLNYLGMPLTLRAPSREDFMPLLEKLEQRLEGWRARLLSRGGRLQLIKSVLSSIPTYYMSCFRLPRWLIDRIDTIRRNFLWSKPQAAAAIHLLNWKTVLLPIKCGGLGVTDLHLQNMALLLRWWWNLFCPEHRLWKEYASSLYAAQLPQPGPLILAKKGSFFWSSISSLRPLFHSCSRFEILSGQQVSFWFDGWDTLPLANGSKGTINRRNISLSQAHLCCGELFEAPLTYHHHQIVQKLHNLVLRPGADRLLWKLSSSGVYTARSVYRVLSQGGKESSQLTSIWKIKATPTMKVFLFLLLKNRILTHDNMLRRHLPHTPGCMMCPQNGTGQLETSLHMFIHCPFAQQIWSTLSLNIGYPLLTLRDTLLHTYLASVPVDCQRVSLWGTLFLTAVWMIWLERNNRTFRHNSVSAPMIVGRILQQVDLLRKYC